MPLSKELKNVLRTCTNNESKDPQCTVTNSNNKNKNDSNNCCVTVCLNTLKQLRKVLEQRCCMAGKTIV